MGEDLIVWFKQKELLEVDGKTNWSVVITYWPIDKEFIRRGEKWF